MAIGYDDANGGADDHGNEEGNGWYVQKKSTFSPNIQLLREASTSGWPVYMNYEYSASLLL